MCSDAPVDNHEAAGARWPDMAFRRFAAAALYAIAAASCSSPTQPSRNFSGTWVGPLGHPELGDVLTWNISEQSSSGFGGTASLRAAAGDTYGLYLRGSVNGRALTFEMGGTLRGNCFAVLGGSASVLETEISGSLRAISNTGPSCSAGTAITTFSLARP